jgi:hypothetical protein
MHFLNNRRVVNDAAIRCRVLHQHAADGLKSVCRFFQIKRIADDDLHAH